MASKIEIVSNIFKQVVDLHGLSPRQVTEGDDFRLPRLIPAGNGRVIQISKPIDDLITQLSDILKSERPQLTRSVRLDRVLACCSGFEIGKPSSRFLWWTANGDGTR
jgi:hypothetical protein